MLFIVAWLFSACFDDGQDPGAQRQREQVNKAARNECSQDSDCMVTGCHGTVCRARRDNNFCEQQLVLRWLGEGSARDEEAAIKASIRGFARPHLDADELASLRVWVDVDVVKLSFHAQPERRRALEQAFAAPRAGGWYAPHPESENGLETLVASGLRIRASEEGPRLLEALIEAGDVERAKQRLLAALPDARRVDKHVAFEVLTSTDPPVVRAWLLETQPRIPFSAMRALNLRTDTQAPWIAQLDGALSPEGAQTLASWPDAVSVWPTRLVLVNHDVVLAAPRRFAAISDGRWTLSWSQPPGTRWQEARAALLTRLAPLQESSHSLQQLRLDADATQRAEAFLTCFQRTPPLSPCSCMEGRCQWQDPDALKQCVREPPSRVEGVAP